MATPSKTTQRACGVSFEVGPKPAKLTLVTCAASVSLGSLLPLAASQNLWLRSQKWPTEPANCCRSPADRDAAMRPVEPAIRCDRTKLKGCVCVSCTHNEADKGDTSGTTLDSVSEFETNCSVCTCQSNLVLNCGF